MSEDFIIAEDTSSIEKCVTMDPELARRALEELNERPEHRHLDIQALRELVADEPNLTCRTDNAFLLRFLRARKFDVDRAFKLIQKSFKMKAKYEDLYVNFRPSSMLITFNENLHNILPDRDPLGRRVFIIRIGYWNPEICTREDVWLCMQICLESIIDEVETQINGIVLIADMENFTLHKATYVTPSIAYKFVSLVQDCFPGRFKGFHYVNEPSFFGKVFQIIEPFFNKKLRARVHFHGHNRESLHKHIPADILPQELGGLKPPTDNSEFVKSLLARDEAIASTITDYGYS